MATVFLLEEIMKQIAIHKLVLFCLPENSLEDDIDKRRFTHGRIDGKKGLYFFVVSVSTVTCCFFCTIRVLRWKSQFEGNASTRERATLRDWFKKMRDCQRVYGTFN